MRRKQAAVHAGCVPAIISVRWGPLPAVSLYVASVTYDQLRMTLLLTCGQRVIAASRQATCLHHSPHFLSSRGHDVISHCHKKKGEDSAVSYFKREGETIVT